MDAPELSDVALGPANDEPHENVADLPEASGRDTQTQEHLASTDLAAAFDDLAERRRRT